MKRLSTNKHRKSRKKGQGFGGRKMVLRQERHMVNNRAFEWALAV
jgi:hypothetical protein